MAKKILIGILTFCFNFYLSAQFEKNAIRQTASESELDLIQDSLHTYLRLTLCGDINYNASLKNYMQRDDLYQPSFRTWYRQIKPLFFFSDLVVANLKCHFPEPIQTSGYESAPDAFLGELAYSGFNVLLLSNPSATTKIPEVNQNTIEKMDKWGFYRTGLFYNSLDRKRMSPLVLEKKDIRVGILNYSTDSMFYNFPTKTVCFFEVDSVKKDIEKAQKMLVDYIIMYIDWGNFSDSLKLSNHIQLINSGVDVIIGTGQKGFTSADVLDFSGGQKKIIVNSLGALNSDSTSRETDKSAIIEVILKKNKKTQAVRMHDMGFIPIWTLMDPERYAVLPISNIEERHIENINLNYLQYSNMKIALTDLRYGFFDKIPEIHYDFNDRIVNAVEETVFFRKTVLIEQEKINEAFREKGVSIYANMFGQMPPPEEKVSRYIIPFEDNLKIYTPKKKVIKWQKAIDRDMDTVDFVNEANGITSVRANKVFYSREKDTTTPLTKAQIRIRDSIKNYRDRFYVKDTIAEQKAKLRKERAEAKRIKDSIYKASLNPDYIPQMAPIFEPLDRSKLSTYRESNRSGIFTTSDPTQEEKSPIKEIEEYFMIQFYSFSKPRPVALDKMPFLAGYEIRFEEGLYKYYIGRTRSPQVAIEMCRQIISKGIKDAMVIKFTDGKRTVYKTFE